MKLVRTIIICHLIIILFLITPCSNSTTANEIVIEGTVKNVPNGKMYLTEAHHWQVNLDSTECVDGYFIFKIKNDSTFVPHKASIYFTDSTTGRKRSLIYRDHMRGADSLRIGNSAFFLERGYTRIEGDNNAKPNLRVFAGKETDLMFKFHAGFGGVGDVDSNRRIQRINYSKSQIKKYPFSYFLLREIYNKRGEYSEKEWTDILSLFDDDVQSSKLGQQIRTYLANRTDPNTPYPNLSLLNSNNQRGTIIDQTAKVNMIIFWASWCGPCRAEIPVLKELRNEYKDKGLNMVSISIDESQENWENALRDEKMTWTQYLVDKEKAELVMQQFNIYGVPLVIFTDSKGMEIKKFLGYDKEQKKNYEEVITRSINKYE